MAVTKVIDIVRRAERILNDEDGIRWTRLELQDWINDAYKEIVLARPDANAITATVSLRGGTRQNLIDEQSINLPNALRVIDVIRNMAATSNKRSIRMIDRQILDDQLPTWHSANASVNISQWMFDLRVPKEFFVSPPAPTPTIDPPVVPAQVEISYACCPTPHTLTDSELDPNAQSPNTTTINLDDIYANAILDYALARCYLKDANYAANGQRAVNHMNSFNSSLGLKTSVDAGITKPSEITRGA